MKADEPFMARLMVASQAGDAEAYTLLLREVSLWLKRYFMRRIAPSRLDDLIQEVLISLHKKRATYDPDQPFLPWLAAIARYRWIDQLRLSYRDAPDVAGAIDARVESDEEVVMARISLDRLFGKLSPDQAAAIELVKIDGLSVREAAQRCGQSEPAIKVNIHRGLRKMAALVEEADV